MAPDDPPDSTILPPGLHKPVPGARPEETSPPSAKGVGGLLERLTGPYATTGDKVGVVLGGVVAGLMARRAVIAARPSAGMGEELLAFAAAGTLVGGAMAGSSERARAWNRPAEGFDRNVAQLMAYTAAHVHPMAVAMFAPAGARGTAFLRGALLYAGTIGATAVVASRPAEEQGTWAWGSTAALSTASLTALRMPAGWEWLGPTYATRLVVAHAATA